MRFNFSYKKETFSTKLLVILAIIVGIFSFAFTSFLVSKLAEVEKYHIHLYAKSQEFLTNNHQNNENVDIFIWQEIIHVDHTIPVILTDTNKNVKYHRNINIPESFTEEEKKNYLLGKMDKMVTHYKPIPVYEANNTLIEYIYYDDSPLLYLLKYFPEVQVSVIIMGLIVFFLLFSYSRRAEQNKIWAGMAKETAHQLATPISGLNGWLSFLEDVKEIEPTVLEEIMKDINRLEIITERFSNVGAKPTFKEINLIEVIQDIINYLRKRISQRIEIYFLYRRNREYNCFLNISLFSWVIENICKNAVNAIPKKGKISVYINHTNTNFISIAIQDTGIGIKKSQFKKIFEPGYTTREDGWGLGLSLAKRIIEEYHEGKIWVYKSKIGLGTTFRILIPYKEINKRKSIHLFKWMLNKN